MCEITYVEGAVVHGHHAVGLLAAVQFGHLREARIRRLCRRWGGIYI